MSNSELTELFQIGNKIQIFYNEDNPNNRSIEIRAIVDDGHVVFRSWSKEKQRWRYEIEAMAYFRLVAEQGNLSLQSSQ